MEHRQPYPTDLDDTEWLVLQPLVPAPKAGGRPETYAKREIVHAILSVLRTGCAWRLLPRDVPPWGFVYHDCWRWRREGIWKRIHDTLRRDLRPCCLAYGGWPPECCMRTCGHSDAEKCRIGGLKWPVG